MQFWNNPVKTAFFVFVLSTAVVVLITGFKITILGPVQWGFYDADFWENTLVESHGMLFDILVIGIFILWLNRKREKRQEIQTYRHEIEDFRDWHSDEAKYRIIGNIKRLARLDVTNNDLRKCYLKGADLRARNLNGSIFTSAMMDDAELSDGDFEDCVFFTTSLKRASLSGANLRGAVLMRTELEGSVLNEADLSKSIIFNVNFSNIDLSDVKLEGAQYDSRTRFQIDFTEVERTKKGMILNDDCYKEANLKMNQIYKAIYPGKIKKTK